MLGNQSNVYLFPQSISLSHILHTVGHCDHSCIVDLIVLVNSVFQCRITTNTYTIMVAPVNSSSVVRVSPIIGPKIYSLYC